MSDQQKPMPTLRPEVDALIRGMNCTKHSQYIGGQWVKGINITALHFDDPVVNDMVDIFVRLNPQHPRY